MLPGEIIVYLLLMLLCLVLSAFFSSSETAFTFLSKLRLRHLAATGVPWAGRAVRMMEHPERFLAAVLLGNNIVNTALAVLATVVATAYLGEKQAVVITTIAVTLTLLLLGDVIPKGVAAHHAEKVVSLFVRPMGLVTLLLSPLTTVLAWISRAVGKLIGVSYVPKSLVTEEEVHNILALGVDEGTMDATEAELIRGVFRFGDRRVKEVMFPRSEIAWVEKGTTLTDFQANFLQTPHYRFPVYQDSIDNVAGILTLKDITTAQARGELKDTDDVTAMARPAYFVPETKLVAELFEEMQGLGLHMAVAVDEYGGTAGLVTIQQLLEEIVGPIADETGKTDQTVETIDESTSQIEASMLVDEANEALGLNLPEGQYDTVAGFLLATLGRIPAKGDSVRHRGLRLVVASMKGIKIEKVLIIKD
ncbi:MAG: HlyC/CorC family transporter [Chloroflexi bacterium]|nr:HlyC/CorC family transporter [Chloroflexota bacterium]